MRFTFGLVFVYFVLVAYAQIASATTDVEAVSLPVTPWDIKPFYKQDGFPTEECVMRTQFDNNLEITFKGKNKQFTAIRVKDIGQNAQSDIKGFIGLGLDKNSYGLQSRSTRGQIDASLLTVPAPAQKLIDLDQFRLRLGTNDYYFSTAGLEEGYQSFLACLGEEELETLKIVNEPITYLPKSPSPEVDMPTAPLDLVKAEELYDLGDDTYALLPSVPMDAPASPPSMTTLTDADNQTWMAKKNDSLKDTLSMWADRAGVNVQLDLEKDIMLPKDFAILGPFDIAVSQLLKEVDASGADTSLSAGLKTSDGDVVELIEPNVSSAVENAVQNNALAVKNTSPRQWQALQGTNLRSVVQRWSARENIDFIWNADEIFIIKESLRDARNFNEAVASLIAQFDGQKIRPTATLNIDPETGRQSVIITSKKH